MNKKTVNISLPKIEGVKLKNATVDLEKGVVVAEYGQEDIKKDISEIPADFESALDYLLENTHQPRLSIAKKHMAKKLKALNKLLILAEAWNSFDEFEPDWANRDQYKYCPFFEFVNGKFEFTRASSVRFILDTHMSNFSFKTKDRSEQFGKQFIDLFKIVLTN